MFTVKDLEASPLMLMTIMEIFPDYATWFSLNFPNDAPDAATVEARVVEDKKLYSVSNKSLDIIYNTIVNGLAGDMAQAGITDKAKQVETAHGLYKEYEHILSNTTDDADITHITRSFLNMYLGRTPTPIVHNKSRTNQLEEKYEWKSKEDPYLGYNYFLDADLNMHGIIHPHWSGTMESDYDGLSLCMSKTLDGTSCVALMATKSGHLLGYVTVRGGKLERHLAYISAERDYLFKLFKGGVHVKDICNHSPEQLKRIQFDVEGQEGKLNKLTYDYRQLSNNQIAALVECACEYNIDYAQLETEIKSTETPRRSGWIENKLKHRKDDIALATPHEEDGVNYDVVCASIHKNGATPFLLADDYKIGTEAYECAVCEAFPSLCNFFKDYGYDVLKGCITRDKVPSVYDIFCLATHRSRGEFFMDTYLNIHDSKALDEPLHIMGTKMDIALVCVNDRSGKREPNGIGFYTEGDWAQIGCYYKNEYGNWEFVPCFISEETNTVLGVGKDSKYTRAICAPEDKLLNSTAYLQSWNGNPNKVSLNDLCNSKYVNYRELPNDLISELMDRFPDERPPHSEDDGITLEHVEIINITPGFNLKFYDYSNLEKDTFIEEANKVWKGLKHAIERLSHEDCSVQEMMGLLLGNRNAFMGEYNMCDFLISNQCRAFSKRGINPVQWWINHFPKGALSKDEALRLADNDLGSGDYSKEDYMHDNEILNIVREHYNEGQAYMWFECAFPYGAKDREVVLQAAKNDIDWEDYV